MQGARGYLDSILDAMRNRGEDSLVPAGKGSKIPGVQKDGEGAFIDEESLAEYIAEKASQVKLTYALFKGNPVGSGGVDQANGYDYQIFDIG